MTNSKSIFQKRKFYIIGLIAIIILVVVILSGRKYLPFSSDLIEILPEPDLTGIEIQVVEKLRYLRQEVIKNPSSHDRWGKYAMNLDVHDFKQEAIICYKQANKLYSAEFRWPYFTAIAFAEMGAKEAFTWFERSSRLKPDYAPLYVLLGRAYFDSGQQEPAMTAFLRAIEIDSTSSHAHLGIAKISFYQMELEKSLNHLKKALVYNPQNREAYGLQVQIYKRLGDSAKAETALQMKERLPKVTSIPDSVYGDLIDEGVSAAWYQERGQLYMKKGQYEKAVQEYQSVLRLRPDAEDHNNLGLSFQKLGDYDQAVFHFRESVALNPQKIEANINLGTALYESGQTNEAIAYLKKVQRMDPDFTNINLILGTMYMRSGQTKNAIAEYQTGLAKNPEDIHLAVQMAWVLATSSKKSFRDGKKAINIAQNLCEKTNYVVPELLDVLACAYAETGQFDQAVGTAQRALQLAQSANKKNLTKQIQMRMDLYRSKQAYRSPEF